MDKQIIDIERSSDYRLVRENKTIPDTSHKSRDGISDPGPGYAATINAGPRLIEDCFLNAGEVAEYLHISRSMVYKMIECRQIPAVRIGRLLRISRCELDQTLRNQAEDR